MKMCYLFATKDCFEIGHKYKKGECVSKHKALSAATQKTNKLNRKFSGSPIVGPIHLIESEEIFEVGEVYLSVVDEYLKECERTSLSYLLADILESEKTNGTFDVTNRVGESLLSRLEDYNITLEELKSCYMNDAEKILDQKQRSLQRQAEEASRRQALASEFVQSRSEMFYTFPAVRGIQAGKEYYTAQVPYKYLVRLFVFDDDDVLPPELRAQRVLNETRANKISIYIGENLSSYVLPSLTATVSSEMSFDPIPVEGSADRLGTLHVPMDATLLINDGQHRRRGIELALAENPSLAEETICVTIYFDQGLKRSQQMFADINGNHVKPPSSINALYNHRDEFGQWVMSILDANPDIKGRIEMENSSVGKRSYKIWSLVSFGKFISHISGLNSRNFSTEMLKKDEKSEYLDSIVELITRYLAELKALPQWHAMVLGNMSAYEAREQFVCAHAVFLEALGLLGRSLLVGNSIDTTDWKALKKLKSVDVNRNSKVWDGRCVVLGKMQKTTDGVNSTASILLTTCGLELPLTMRKIESNFEQCA